MINFDFTLNKYKELLVKFLEFGYRFLAVEEYSAKQPAFEKWVVLRHDVDKRPQSSLQTAFIEKDLGIKSTYYFRIVEESNKGTIIKEIAKLGHEIGYHYEDLALFDGNLMKAIDSFRSNLAYFREFYPVKTICMHGSPLSKWDNRHIWQDYDYRDHGIVAEPYFDFDFNEVFYLTDTGRRWNGEQVAVRDKVASPFSHNLRTTSDILTALNNNELPSQIMITTHPQRWSDHPVIWAEELVMQNIKNTIKRLFIVKQQ